MNLRYRAIRLRSQVRELVLRQHPLLRRRGVTRADPTAIVLGRSHDGTPVCLSVLARLEHMHVVGTTGGGKTRLIQHCACQDIAQGRGVCIIDPHGNHEGSMHRSILEWIARRPHLRNRTIHLIDPNIGSHITGFNALSLPSAEYDPPVIAEAMQEALERVWGEEDMNTKPTMQRVLSALLTTLTELKLTIADARLLFDPDDRHGVRAWAIRELKDEEAREELQWLHSIAADARGPQDFRMEVTGPRNRLTKLTRSRAVKLIVSQDVDGIDFRAALDEGHIILANLSPGPFAGDKAVQMLGRLLTRSISFHTMRRRHPERPFFLYLDECQRYLSGDVSQMLAETRKYGTGVVLAHQTLAQLRAAGEDVLDAVKSTTNIKVVTRIKDPAEAAELADMVVRHNLEMPVSILNKPTVVGHIVVRRANESESEQAGVTESSSRTTGESVTESESYMVSLSDTLSESIGTSETDGWGTSDSHSVGRSDSDAFGTSTAVNLSPGAINALPAAATGNTIGESAGTYANVDLGSPTGYLIDKARHEPAVVAGLGITRSRQRSAGMSDARQWGSSLSGSVSRSTQRGTARTEGRAWTTGVAYSTSESNTQGIALSRTAGKSRGWSETLEPFMEDRPSAVHSLDNLRYMAAEVLRSLPAGRVTMSVVDGSGLRTAVVQAANVPDCELTNEEFDELRQQFLQRSPSAVPINAALAALAHRQTRILRLATQLRDAEPDSPGFRTKRKRKEPEKSVETHGGKNPPEPPPVKGPDRRRRRP